MVDASAVVALLLGDDHAVPVLAVTLGEVDEVHAPHLLDVEVANALRRGRLRGELGEARAETALLDLGRIPITRWPHARLLPRVWDLRHGLTAYDAAYLALAEALGAGLLTLDGGLAEVARRTVEVVSP